jgi:endonuclease III
MKAFPTFGDLARADVDEVMRLWSGLGYYSRGRKLLEAAKYVEERGVPETVKGWKEVPGCGDYTAGAVSRYRQTCDKLLIGVSRLGFRRALWTGMCSACFRGYF